MRCKARLFLGVSFHRQNRLNDFKQRKFDFKQACSAIPDFRLKSGGWHHAILCGTGGRINPGVCHQVVLLDVSHRQCNTVQFARNADPDRCTSLPWIVFHPPGVAADQPRHTLHAAVRPDPYFGGGDGLAAVTQPSDVFCFVLRQRFRGAVPQEPNDPHAWHDPMACR